MSLCVNHENKIIKEEMISSFYDSFKKDLEEEMTLRLSITAGKILLGGYHRVFQREI